MSFVTGTRRFAGPLLTALAGAVVLTALLLPNEIGRITPGEFLRIPAEAILGVAVLFAVPRRVRPATAALIGAGIGVLTLLKLLDMGFLATLGRPFDVLADWRALADAAIFLAQSGGAGGAVAAALATALLAVGVVAATTWSAARLARLVVLPHRRAAVRGVAVSTALWTACIVTEAELVAGIEVASDSTATLALYRAQQVRADVLDLQRFEGELATDPVRDVPPANLLTALRGKDVVVAFVESYGRVALTDPAFAPQVGALLDGGTRRLAAAGFGARSAYLTSPTTGAGSWLAHATMLSGLWVDGRQRHDALQASERRTLVGDFREAGWRTAGIMPGVFLDWPEGAFYRYHRVRDFDELGYEGPRMSFATMPDQYTLKAFEELERSAPEPVMAVIPLVTSHAPWNPLPPLLDWDEVGDGSAYDFMAGRGEQPEAILTRDPATVRADYRRALEYSLTSLLSYVETFGDEDLVVVLLGDHQPSPVVTGGTADHDVPISIVAKDPAVLDRIAGWRWQDGLRPGPHAPVRPMDGLREQFVSAFSEPRPQP